MSVPHLDEESVTRIQNAERRQQDLRKDPDKALDRGRAPSHDQKGKKWRKNGLGS